MKYKTDLERILTAEERKREPQVSHVSISKDGEFVISNIADRYTVRRLSPLEKEFLLNGNGSWTEEPDVA